MLLLLEEKCDGYRLCCLCVGRTWEKSQLLPIGLRTLNECALISTRLIRSVLNEVIGYNVIVGALENIYKDRVAAVFDDKIKQCDAQIASYTQNLTRMFHKCESRLKNLQKRRICFLLL